MPELCTALKCGDECRLVSFSLKKVEKIMQNCNQYGIDPIHLSEIIEDEMLEDKKSARAMGATPAAEGRRAEPQVRPAASRSLPRVAAPGACPKLKAWDMPP